VISGPIAHKKAAISLAIAATVTDAASARGKQFGRGIVVVCQRSQVCFESELATDTTKYRIASKGHFNLTISADGN
jgi:hypothetical protein